MARNKQTTATCFLVAALAGLRGAGFSSDLHIFQTCSATSPAVFINNLPKTLAHQFDICQAKFPAVSPIALVGWSGTADLAVLIQHWRAVLIQDLVTKRG